MQRLALFRILLILVLIAGFFLYFTLSRVHPQKKNSPAPTITQAQTVFCHPKDMQAKIEMGHAAGNVYGILTLENISKESCTIIGNNTIMPHSSAKNIAIAPTGTTQNTIELFSRQMLFGKVHYPNGPQCQSRTVNAKISFLYTLSPKETVTFSDLDGNTQQDIVVCASSKEVTKIDTWYLSQTQQ